MHVAMPQMHEEAEYHGGKLNCKTTLKDALLLSAKASFLIKTIRFTAAETAILNGTEFKSEISKTSEFHDCCCHEFEYILLLCGRTENRAATLGLLVFESSRCPLKCRAIGTFLTTLNNTEHVEREGH